MNRFSSYKSAVLLLPIFVIGCGTGSGTGSAGKAASANASPGEEFLRWSMDKNMALTSYESDVSWTARASTSPQPQEFSRRISFVSPNKFKVVAKSKEISLTSVSNGKRYLEFTSDPNFNAMAYPPPARMSDEAGELLGHPMACGSLLYAFFEGGKGLAKVADLNQDITFGPEEATPGGEPGKLVKFYATGSYGHTEALIGANTGLVYRLKYHCEPALQESQAPPGTTLEIEEKFSNIKSNANVPDSNFDSQAPAGMKVVDRTLQFGVGTKAPDIAVKSLKDGKEVKLSDYRGKVVLIDFWATWCGPCVEGLPVTARFSQKYGSKGLQVLAVTSEDKATVEGFLKKQGLSLPVFLDTGGLSGATYRVDSIPTVSIIDKDGNLAFHEVGLQPEEKILEGLKKAGLKTD